LGNLSGSDDAVGLWAKRYCARPEQRGLAVDRDLAGEGNTRELPDGGSARSATVSSLLTFARGGTLAEDTTNPSFAPGQRGPGQGVWETTSHDVFKVRSVAFINFSTQGFEAGQQIIEQTITYEDQSDQWKAVATIKFADTNGTVYRQGCATATATRF